MTITRGALGGAALSPEAGDSPARVFAAAVAVMLAQGLRVFAFERRGVVVAVDGIRRRGPGDRAPLERGAGIRYEPPSAFLHSEPRIRLFVDFLARALDSYVLTFRGQPVDIDAVRLANLQRWARYRMASLFDNLSPVTSACSANCVFCYREGTRHGALLGLAPRMLGMEEARTRARYWRSDRKVGLPHRLADAGEPFVNAHFFDILDVVRPKDPTAVLTLLTNGDDLDSSCVRRLSGYKPLLVVLSVNTADVARRRQVMRSRNAENGARAPDLLREAGIPFIGSIVAEQRLGLADIERTIRSLGRQGASRVRVLLPGFTRYSLHQALPGVERWWRQVADLVLSVRESVDCPVIASPALYWDTQVVPRIEGLYVGSIGKAAGLRIGDVVLDVNGRPVLTKVDALRLLTAASGAEAPCALRIRRGECEFDVKLSSPRGGERGGPSSACEWEPGDDCYGIFMNRGLDLESFAWIRQQLGRLRRKRRALLFSSRLAQPHVSALAGHWKDFDRGHDVRTTVADHDFWGGNIQVADLHVVDDYVAQIRRITREGWRPDLAFIPESFLVGKWGFDVAGNSYRRIEAETGVRIVLVPVTRIME